MKLQQLSVFLENKPGQLQLPVQALADAGISITALSLADTEEFGIMRMIVEEPLSAREVLEKAGCLVNVCEVLAVEVPDRAGGLAQILQCLHGEPVNLEYMYAFSCGTQGTALIVFRFDDPDKAVEVLTRNGVNVRERSSIFSGSAVD